MKPPFGTLNATLAKVIISNAPRYTEIVEPFGDGGTLALELAKRRPKKHTVNIENEELFLAFQFAQTITSADRRKLKSFDWISSQETFDNVTRIATPPNLPEGFYRWFYLKNYGMRADMKDPDSPIILDVLGIGSDVFPKLYALPLMKVGLKNVILTNDDPLKALKVGGGSAFSILLPKKAEHVESVFSQLKSWSGDFFYAAKVQDGARVIEIASSMKDRNVTGLSVASIMMSTMSVVTNYETDLVVIDPGTGEPSEAMLMDAVRGTLKRSRAIPARIMSEFSLRSYQSQIKGIVRSLWRGTIDRRSFNAQLRNAIRFGLLDAWAAGERACGIKPEDRTSEERKALNKLINRDLSYVSDFGAWVQANSKGTMKLQPLLSRTFSWINRWNEAKNMAQAMACADKKYAWRLGPTDHCSTCLKMNGKVKRASQWADADVRPQHQNLACKGYKCQCFFEQTDALLSKGRIPSMP